MAIKKNAKKAATKAAAKVKKSGTAAAKVAPVKKSRKR